jgi:hypothetical protein
MIDLPANVILGENPDGWSLRQDEDAIRSVQAFLGGDGRLIVELWGTGPLLSPAGQRRDDVEFQQMTRIDLRDRSWQTERLYFNVVDDASHRATRRSHSACTAPARRSEGPPRPSEGPPASRKLVRTRSSGSPTPSASAPKVPILGMPIAGYRSDPAIGDGVATAGAGRRTISPSLAGSTHEVDRKLDVTGVPPSASQHPARWKFDFPSTTRQSSRPGEPGWWSTMGRPVACGSRHGGGSANGTRSSTRSWSRRPSASAGSTPR